MDSKEQYSAQRSWSDRYIPQAKLILTNLHCNVTDIRETTFEVDTKQAADLVIASCGMNDDIYVALRLRKSSYANRWPYEFTVRYAYTDGYETEHAKIMSGYADIMLYGFVIEGQIARWILLDMDVYRQEAEKEYIVKEHKFNTDGRNSFLAYDIRSFAGQLIILHSEGYFDK